VEKGVVGDPTVAQTEVGPIVNESQLEEVLAGIEKGRADGGTVLAGGERLDDEAYLVAPTLFEGLADDAFLSCQEVFGPVTTLYRFSSLGEALRRANAVEYGLSASIFTSSLASARTFAQEIEAGIVRINGQTAGADVHVPFGGVKSSGFGPHEQGRAAREFYTEVVTVYEDV
jgi:aldehyde dehydrogenase (NAD+)